MVSQNVNGRVLGVASFLCGACVMVLEMAGSRVVAPYMGTSLVVWTSLIGIIMVSLTLGYWLGGRVADRRPEMKILHYIILTAALVTAIVGAAASPVLEALSASVRNVYIASVIASAVLFAVPSVLLGMVSPFIVRLAMRNVLSSGGTVGKFSALSSAGSIIGTFLGGFVLISFFSSRTILFMVAFVLALTALIVRGHHVVLPVIAAIFAAACGFYFESGDMAREAKFMETAEMSDEITVETHYNTIRITERAANGTNLRVRILQTDPLGAQSLMYVDRPNDLYSDYTKFYDLAFHYKPDAGKILMLGGGGYCVPKHIAATRPGVDVDVVELDPGITDAARKYFNLKDRPGQRIFHEDARMFVNRESEAGAQKYDAVFEDVFGSSYNIPFHMTTSECMKKIRAMMSDDGVFVVNIISSIDGELFSGIYAGVASAFPTVMIYPATYPNSSRARQNIMIVALANEDEPYRAPDDDYMASLLNHRWTNAFEPKTDAFTDAFAPVEKYSLLL
ncbi:MAG: fused MFS/spermidine synthase [Synergistaceae bacterium]|jgi:spermidine synthase|nr:fused MFS/spermidine synthase [Synergistaceae bacterium]